MEIIRFADVASTNSIALELGQQGAAHRTVVLANQQSKGRGRLERTFASPPGGLYISIILRPNLEPELIPLITLAAGVACCKSVERLTGLTLQLKWPNDVYIGNKKLAGILTESAPYSVHERKFPFLVVGIGLNVNTGLEKYPPALQDSVTSLYCLQNTQYDPEQFVPDIVDLLSLYTENLMEEKSSVFSFWQERDYLFDKHICWINPAGEQVFGKGAGMHHDGRYTLITTDGQTRYILGGELRLPAPLENR